MTTQIETKKGKQSFDREQYARKIIKINALLDGIEKELFAIADNDGNFIRDLTPADLEGINSALMVKFRGAGSESAARSYADAIDSKSWPVSVVQGDLPTWVVDFKDFLSNLDLDLLPLVTNDLPSDGDRTRYWSISCPKTIDESGEEIQGFFGAKLKKALTDYMVNHNLKTYSQETSIDEELDIERLIAWSVYLSSPRAKK